MKKCPYCAEEIQDEAIKCKHCQSLIKAEEKVDIAAESMPVAQKNKPEEKFKMTFANSWWQWIIALVVIVPIRGLLAVASMLIISLLNLPDSESLGKDLASVINILSLVIAIWIAFKLSRRTWERKQKKLFNSLNMESKPNTPQKKIMSWKTIVLLILALPVGYLLAGMPNQNIASLGEILKAVGMLAIIFWIANGVWSIFAKKGK